MSRRRYVGTAVLVLRDEDSGLVIEATDVDLKNRLFDAPLAAPTDLETADHTGMPMQSSPVTQATRVMPKSSINGLISAVVSGADLNLSEYLGAKPHPVTPRLRLSR